MTLPSSGQISTADVSAETGQSYSTDLNFLNSLIVPGQRPGSPNMDSFHGKAWFQNNTQGNCNNGNCNCSGNCGNIQCQQCYASQCVNCANCDGQNWLQANCNCACTYNCNANQTSYNCNCACNCSKIICAKLYEFGMMDYRVWSADQAYGEWLKANDRNVYKGYIKWARIVTSWMDGSGPDFMVWIKDKEKRKLAQKEAATKWAYNIGTPWSLHMAYLMGAVEKDNLAGRITMAIGRPICKIVNVLPKRRNPGVFTSWTMWSLFFFSYFVSQGFVKVANLISKFKKQKKLFFSKGTVTND